MSKSEKMYKDSPSVKKDEDGKPGISKPSQADAENMGTDGNGIPGTPGSMPVDVHQKTSEMMDRHHAEIKDMQKRHEKEHSGIMKEHEESKNVKKDVK